MLISNVTLTCGFKWSFQRRGEKILLSRWTAALFVAATAASERLTYWSDYRERIYSFGFIKEYPMCYPVRRRCSVLLIFVFVIH